MARRKTSEAARLLSIVRTFEYVSDEQIGAMFGVTRQRVKQLRDEYPDFPDATFYMDGRGGTMTKTADVIAWAKQHRPDAGKGWESRLAEYHSQFDGGKR